MEKNYNLQGYINEIIQCVMATFLIGVGVAIFISCELGSDSLTVFLDGMNRYFGFSVSLVNQIAAIIILILAIKLNKGAIGINTVVSALTVGLCIEIGYHLIIPFHISKQSLIIRIIILFFAQIMLSIGYGWMQTFNHGMSYSDAMLYGIAKKMKVDYIYIRYVYDFSFFLIGVALGGVIGIGTLFSISTLGYFISIFKKMIDNLKIRT